MSDTIVNSAALKNLLVKALTGRGSIYGHVGRLDQGIADYERVINETDSSTVRGAERAEIMLNLAGLMGESRSDFEKARALVHKALAGIGQRQAPELYAHAAQILGNISKNLGATDQALEHYRHSLALYKRSGDRVGQAGAFCNIGLIHLRRREFKDAERYFNYYHRISCRIGDRVGAARSLNNLAIAKTYGKDLTAAEKIYRMSLAISQKVGNKMGIGITCGELGLIHKNRGELDQALKYYERYLGIARELGFRMGIDIVNLNIADVYYLKRDWRRALTHYRRSGAEASRIGDQEGVAFSLAGTGKVRLGEKRYPEALKCLTEARTFFSKLEMMIETTDVLYHIGLTLEGLGRGKRARDCFRESHDLAKKTGDAGLIGLTRDKLGTVK